MILKFQKSLITSFFIGLAFLLSGQQSSFNHVIEAIQKGDSIAALSTLQNFSKTNKSTDSVTLVTMILTSTYPNLVPDGQVGKLNHRDLERVLDMLYSSSHLLFSNPQSFLKVSDYGISTAKKNGLNPLWFKFFTAKASYGMMTKNQDLLQASIKDVDGYDFTNDSLNYASLLYFKATYKKITSDTSAGEWYKQCINVLKDKTNNQPDSSFMAAVCTDYGSHLATFAMLKESVRFYIMGLKYLPEGKNYASVKVGILSRIARTYFRLENTNEAKVYLEEGDRICITNDMNTARIRELLPLYGDIAFGEQNYREALDHYLKVHQQAEQNNSEYLQKIMALKIAHCYLNLKNRVEGEAWFEKSKLKGKADKESDFFELTFLTKRAMVEGRAQAAVTYAGQANELAVKTLLPYLELNAKKNLYEAYKLAGKNGLALSIYEDFQFQRDQLYRQGQEAAVEALQTDYQVSLREEKIATLNALNEAGARVRKGQSILIIGALTALVFLSFLLLQVYKLNQKLKSRNETISQANAEKETLLKEIHHRVKNNLQVISSLLKLQSKYIKDDNAIKAIADGRTRVQSMALLHQSLYKENNLKGVEMRSYFKNLVESLFETYNIEEDKITLTLDIDDLILDVDTVIPLGLITNELISNSLKHAFVGRKHGQISVSLKESDKKLILIVWDDGIGIDIDKSPNNGFGAMLIDSLSSKLDGKIVRKTSNGSQIEIIISDYWKIAG